MPEFQIFKAKDKNDLELYYPVMKDLRKEFSFNEFMEIYEQAHSDDGYEIVGVECDGKVAAVMGYRVNVHGKHLFIDNLVSTEFQCSKGLGAQLLTFAENFAKELGCKVLRLFTGIDNELGKKFYERHNWKLRTVAYKKKLS